MLVIRGTSSGFGRSCCFLLKRGAIGTRRTIMEDGVERRLKERDQERADTVPLTEEKRSKALKPGLPLRWAATLQYRFPMAKMASPASRSIRF